MPNDERCPKYPSMLKAFCSHCQGSAPGTRDNPVFSLKKGWYQGFPVVEVLKNGGPIHSYDSNFRFGVRKAQVIVACIEILKEFWQSGDDGRIAFRPRIVQDLRHGLRVQTFVEMHPDFEVSTGNIVDRPWLRLQALPPDKEHIGLGALKCRALHSVKEELVHWLEHQ